MAIPDELVQQFRTVAQERLGRIEAAWASVLTALDDDSAVLLDRELHTLKGESKMLGFSDVNLVCHKLEDLIEVARTRGYAVDEDFDLAVNMAIRFMAMLVRKKIGSQLGGIDLPGFIKQIDALLIEVSESSRSRPSNPTLPRPANAVVRIPTALRSRLSAIAVNTFIEYASARNLRRERLRPSWHMLRDLIGIHRAVVGQGQLAKHKSGAQALARELGKDIEVAMHVDSVEATTEMLAAIDAAMLHLVRNAIDHGIEMPADRAAAGKRERGTLHIRSGSHADHFVLMIEDDGRGVSMEEVRARAIDFGLIRPNETSIEDRWLEIVCHPGFTTRAEASDVSGRGVGLDAVRMGIHDVGGVLSAKTVEGKGTTWVIDIPLPMITFQADVFRVPNLAFPIALDASWEPVEAGEAAVVIDVAQMLGLSEDRATQPVHYYRRDDKTIGIVVEQAPKRTAARRLVVPPPPAFAEVVVVDTTECLLLHLDRAFG